MSSPSSPYHVFHQADLYEIFVTGTIVTRVYRYNGNLRRELTFEELPQPVVDELLDKLLEEE